VCPHVGHQGCEQVERQFWVISNDLLAIEFRSAVIENLPRQPRGVSL
jgi:hypothetical protein